MWRFGCGCICIPMQSSWHLSVSGHVCTLNVTVGALLASQYFSSNNSGLLVSGQAAFVPMSDVIGLAALSSICHTCRLLPHALQLWTHGGSLRVCQQPLPSPHCCDCLHRGPRPTGGPSPH